MFCQSEGTATAFASIAFYIVPSYVLYCSANAGANYLGSASQFWGKYFA